MSCKTKKPSLFNRVKSLVLKSNNQLKSNNRRRTRRTGRKTKKSIKKIATHHYNRSLNKFIKKRASKLN